MKRIAILGAAGFIGNRAVEYFHARSGYSPRAVTRSASSLALASRMNVERRVADALDVGAMRDAFAGCEVVLSAVAGGNAFIVDSAVAAFSAAEAAGVGKFIYLSSASVHGQSPAPGTDEDSPLPRKHDLPYNAAKAHAEQRLQERAKGSSTACAILRPGIVYGPRSQWIGGFADALLDGTAYLVNGGTGICNAVYVDNVLHAVEQLIGTSAADGQPLLVGDREAVTWRDMLGPVAAKLGYDIAALPQPDAAEILGARASMADRIKPLAKRGIRMLPARAGNVIRAVKGAAFPRSVDQVANPVIFTRETAMLHGCATRLPSQKAERLIGYDPPVSFGEGMARSLSWLDFAGYPVVDRAGI